MLHENPMMSDIDVDHWRNLQDLILDSAKEKRRIILIHENGHILKFVHSGRADIVRNIDRITNPQADAEAVYRANQAKADFVMLLERSAVDKYFAEIQDTWTSGEDLDEYVHRTFKTLDRYADGIVTYPGPAKSRLGLQWRIGASHEQVKTAVEKFISPHSTVVFGIFTKQALWTSLILGFDAHKHINVITTADPTELGTGLSRQEAAKELVEWASRKYSRCCLGIFMDRDVVITFLDSQDKVGTLRDMAIAGRALADPVPEALLQSLAVLR